MENVKNHRDIKLVTTEERVIREFIVNQYEENKIKNKLTSLSRILDKQL